MAKIAVRLSEEHSLEAGDDAAFRPPGRRQLASGEGWTVSDVLCTAGPQDQPFEEQHSQTCVGIVMSGTFQYRTSTGRELMLPGSLLLGNAGDSFTCGHEHGVGDHCISFFYTQQFCESFKADAGLVKPRFKSPRVAPHDVQNSNGSAQHAENNDGKAPVLFEHRSSDRGWPRVGKY